MNENREIVGLLTQIREENRKQVIYSRITCAAAVVAALCFAGIFLMVYRFLPQLTKILQEMPGIVKQMETVLSNLEQVTEKLTAVDFGTLIDGVNTLVGSGQLGLEQIVEKLNAIDFESLNKAIQNLEAVIEPLAKFFNVFK